MSATRDQILALFDERQQQWRDRDTHGLALGHTIDGVVISPIFGTVHGREAIERSYNELFHAFGDWTFEGEDPIIDGERTAQPFVADATHTSELFGVPATGRRIEIRGVLLYTIVDLKIREERRFYDFTGMLVQLGVLKTRGR
jgi:predicted ester cyclase